MDGSATADPLRPGQGAWSDPADGFDLQLLERLPLVQALFLLFSHVLNAPFLEQLFQNNRQRCYTRKLSFSTIVYLIRDALLRHAGSGRASFCQAQEQHRLPSSIRAVYGKLGRLPLKLSAALLREATLALLPLMPPTGCTQPSSLQHSSLQPLRWLVLDGKTLKHVSHRLKVLRNRRGRVNSGKMLAALDLQRGLVLACQSSRNSEANDVSLVADLLQQVPAQPREIRLYIADRQFCDLPRLSAFSAGGHHFLIRHNRNIYFHPDPDRPAQPGIDAQGRSFVEEWGWLGRAAHRQRRYVRRITLQRPGQEKVAVITDLLDDTRYPAEDLLGAYLARWGIEQVFQVITEVFNLKSLIGSDPKAALFQGAFCMVMYNLIQVVRGYVARGVQKPAEEVSTETLFDDCQKQLTAWMEAGDPQVAIARYRVALDAEQLPSRLQEILGGLWKPRWLKTPKPLKPHGKTRTSIYPKKGYTNVGKLQDALADARHKAQRKARRQN